jgi:hypothetical protein
MTLRPGDVGRGARRRTRFLGAGILASVVVGVAACDHSGSTPGQVTHVDDAADQRASLSVLQFYIDTGQVVPAAIPAGVVQNGTVTVAGPTMGLLIRLSQHYIGPARKFSVNDDAGRLAGLLHGPGPASDAEAALVVAQELVDAGYQDAQSFGGAAGDGLIKSGSAVSAWVGAHSGDPLSPGANVTVGQEQRRVAGFVYSPSSGEPTAAS